MAWYEDIEGKVNKVMDRLEAHERDRRNRLIERRRREAMFASPMRRMTALLIDVAILYVVLGTLFSFLTKLAPPLNISEAAEFLDESIRSLQQGRGSIGLVWQEGVNRGYIQRVALNQVFQLFLLAVAVVPALWRWQCTIGMRIAGLRLRKKDRLSKPGLLRCFAFFFFGVVTLMFGYITMIFSRDRRALHDLLSGTAMVRKKELKEREATEAILAADAAAEAEIIADAEARLRAREPGETEVSRPSQP